MKLWEVIKAMQENPKVKAERIDGMGIAIDFGEVVSISTGNTLILHKTNMESDWKLIKSEPVPVDFMTALKAFSEGKVIYSKSKNGTIHKYKPNNTGLLVDSDGDAIMVEEIQEREWYIEE